MIILSHQPRLRINILFHICRMSRVVGKRVCNLVEILKGGGRGKDKVIVFGPKLPFFVEPKLPFILSLSYCFWEKVTVYESYRFEINLPFFW